MLQESRWTHLLAMTRKAAELRAYGETEVEGRSVGRTRSGGAEMSDDPESVRGRRKEESGWSADARMSRRRGIERCIEPGLSRVMTAGLMPDVVTRAPQTIAKSTSTETKGKDPRVRNQRLTSASISFFNSSLTRPSLALSVESTTRMTAAVPA